MTINTLGSWERFSWARVCMGGHIFECTDCGDFFNFLGKKIKKSSFVWLTRMTSSTWTSKEACTRFEQSDVARQRVDFTFMNLCQRNLVTDLRR